MKRMIKLLACAALGVTAALSALTVGAAETHGTATPFASASTGEHGRLIWKQDFEGDTIGDYAYDPAFASAYADEGAALSDSTLVYVRDGDGYAPDFKLVDNPVSGGTGKVLAMTSKTAYAIYQINFNGNLLSKPGEYTFTAHSYRGSETSGGMMRFYVNRATSGTPEMGALKFADNAFAPTSYSVTVVTPEEFAASGLEETAFTTSKAFVFRTVYLFMSNFTNKTVYWDDLELWYDEYADITFCLDGPTDEVTDAAETLFGVKHRSFKPGSALPKVTAPGSGYTFVGWSKTKGDETNLVSTAEAGTYTLYAVYTDSEGSDLVSYDSPLTVYEAVMLVSRLYASLNPGAAVRVDSFADCLSCAEEKGLLPTDGFESYDRAILRAEIAEMLYAAIPEAYRTESNRVYEIPDVHEYNSFYDAVMALYRAGILSGTDENRTFSAYDRLLRCDFDTLMARILFAENRVSFELGDGEAAAVMLYDVENTNGITASFISAPTDYLALQSEYPQTTLELGKWFWQYDYTRACMRKDFAAQSGLTEALLELQSDHPTDLYINGSLVETSKNADGLYLTGVKDVTALVQSGTNKLALRVYLSDNPDSFMGAVRGAIRLTYADGTVQNVPFDSGWNARATCGFWSGVETSGWMTTDLSSFTASRTVGYSETHPRDLRRSVYLRTAFDTDKTVESATLYASAKGLYVPYLNGKRVTDARFLPGSMDGLTEYQVFDVTGLVKNGTNVLAAELGNGWYNCSSWGVLKANKPALMMQLEITYTDGTSQTVCTDETWLVTASPRTEDDIQYGERYDARLELDGWNSARLPEGTWVSAEKQKLSLKPYANQTYPAVAVQKEVKAVSMGTLKDGTVYYDFGYNTTGRAKLVLKNTKPGERIIIRYCEIIDNGVPYVGTYGDVYFENDTKADGKAPYGVRNIDVYVCKGAAEEVYVPEFAFTGFKYIYISGYSGEYELGTVRKLEMNTDLEETGDIVTSHAGISKIWDAVKRSWRSNIVTGPMDCPTREKNFWNGDIQVFGTTASWYMNTNAFLSRWTQAGRKIEYNVYGWEDEEYILPLILYRFYGNTDVIESKYETVQNLITKRRGSRASGELPTTGSPYSDHQAPEKVPEDFYVGAYYCYMYKSAAEMADILGKTEDAAAYRAEFEACRKSFNTKFYLSSETDYSPKSQGGIVFPLAFGIAEEGNRTSLAAKLHTYIEKADYHLTTGFMGNEYILGILCNYGYGEDAWKAVTNKTYPSLLDMLSTYDGGTTTENWRGYGTSYGTSMNHYSIGCLSRWFFEYLGGITVTSAGFEKVQIKPYFFEEMGDCDVTYETEGGTLSSAWVYDTDEEVFRWTVKIPRGTQATLVIPDGTEFVGAAASEAAVGEGTYSYTVKKNGYAPTIIAPAVDAYDATYGQLVYFNNFSGETRTNLAAIDVYDVGDVSAVDGKNAIAGGNAHTVQSWQNVNGLEFVSSKGLGNAFTYNDDAATPIEGEITIAYEAYSPNSDKLYMYNVSDSAAFGSAEFIGYQIDWSNNAVLSPNTWTAWKSKTVTVPDGMTRIGTRAGAIGKKVYFHSVAVYVKPTNALWLTDKDGGNRTYTLIPNDTYVFPEVFGNTTVEAWTDGTNTYKAGESVTKAAVAGKTFAIGREKANYATAPSAYDATYGQLVYFNNFGEDPIKLAALEVMDAGSGSVVDGKYAVSGGNAHTAKSSQPVYGLEIVSDKGLGNAFTYNDDAKTPLEGQITVTYEAYTKESESFNMYNVSDSTAFGSSEWVGYQIDWSNQTLTPNTWTAWTTRAVTIPVGMTRIGTRAGHLDKSMYFHSVAVYIKPTNALWLIDTDGENRAFELIPSDTYVFPDTFNGVTVSTWTDGTSTYKAGESVAKAAVAGKTFTVGA